MHTETKIIENGIVPIFQDEQENQLVDARTLHEKLEIGKKFAVLKASA